MRDGVLIFAKLDCFFSVSENEHLKLCFFFLFSQIVLVVVLVVDS
jgi:hypothetical protein